LRPLRRRDLNYLDWKRLLQKPIVVNGIESGNKVFQSRHAEYSQRFCALFHRGRVLCAGEQRRYPAAMIEMKVRYPDRVDFGPRQIFLRHSQRHRG